MTFFFSLEPSPFVAEELAFDLTASESKERLSDYPIFRPQ
jgi:hypothetical protein